MMTINIAIDYVKWLVCRLQTRNRFWNMSSKARMISSVKLVCHGGTHFQKFQDLIKSLTWEAKLLWNVRKWTCSVWLQFKMSDWSIGRSNRGVRFWLENVKENCSLEQLRSYKKSLFMGRMYTRTLYTQRVKGIIIHLRKTMYINVYLHVNLTLLKIKTKSKYNWTLLSYTHSFSISSVSIFCNFIIQIFPTTILWVQFVKFSIEHVSKISFATTKWFQEKIQIKMNFSI